MSPMQGLIAGMQAAQNAEDLKLRAELAKLKGKQYEATAKLQELEVGRRQSLRDAMAQLRLGEDESAEASTPAQAPDPGITQEFFGDNAAEQERAFVERYGPQARAPLSQKPGSAGPQSSLSVADLHDTRRFAKPQAAAQPKSDADYEREFVQKYGRGDQSPPAMQMGPPEPQGQQAPAAAPPEKPTPLDTDLAKLRKAALVYMQYGEADTGRRLLDYTDRHMRGRQVGDLMKTVLANPDLPENQRNQLYGSLAQSLANVEQYQSAFQIVQDALPLEGQRLLKQVDDNTRARLLGQRQAPREKPSLAKAAEAQKKRVMFEAQPRQTEAEAGITTTESGERVRITQPTDSK
jgi:hypothetical protein